MADLPSPMRSISAMNPSPCSYWFSLASRPRSRWTNRCTTLAVAPPLLQHPGEAVGRGDVADAGPVHGDVAVAFEQAHQPADLVEHVALLGRGEQVGEAAVGERAAAGADLVDGPLERAEQLDRVEVGGARASGR